MTTTETKGNVCQTEIAKELGISFAVEDLRAIYKTFEGMVGKGTEIKVDLLKTGLVIRCVDAAHVMIKELTLDERALDYYLLEGVDNIGLDLEKVGEIIKLANKGDIVKLDLVGDKLAYEVGLHKGDISLVDTSGMSDPKVPSLKFKARFTIGLKDLEAFVKKADKIADHIRIEVLGESVKFSCQGETDKDEMTVALGKGLTDLKGEPCHSLYSLDYLKGIIKGIKGVSKEIAIAIGENWPMAMAYRDASFNGTFVVLLAPRLENGN